MAFWKNALLRIFTDPSDFNIRYEDDLVWLVDDKYPKSQVHMLLIPKTRIINGVADLQPEHRPLLEHMQKLVAQYVELGYLVGFHRNPSLFQLHCHVMTRDLSLAKTSRHRASFKAESMITIQQAIETITA